MTPSTSEIESIKSDKIPRSIYVMIAVIGFSEGMLKLADLSFTYLYKDDFNLTPADV